MPPKQFLMGNEVLAKAARAAGALGLYGYPITPGSEILKWWASPPAAAQRTLARLPRRSAR